MYHFEAPDKAFRTAPMTQADPFGLDPSREQEWMYRTACDRWVPMRQIVVSHHNFSEVDCPDCWRATRNGKS